MKKSNLLKLLSLALIVVLAAAAFSACNAKKTGLTFKNGLSSDLHEIYVSPSTSDTWGEENLVNSTNLKAGGSIHFEFSKFNGTAGMVYDIGTIDVDGINYDGYNVKLQEGDTISLTGNTISGTFTITHADGTVTTLEAEVYPND